MDEATVQYSTQKYGRDGEAHSEPSQTSNIDLSANITAETCLLFSKRVIRLRKKYILKQSF